jgi:SapC
LINQKLHRQPHALDSVQHRAMTLKVPMNDWSVADKLNALFVAAAEFADVCREFPIVFVKAGTEPDGSDAIAPVAIFGLAQDQNLYTVNGHWRAQYIPAVLRSYPFCIARMDEERFAVCVDLAHTGFNQPDGVRLFDDQGTPGELLKGLTTHLENLEAEVQRTRLVGKRMLELDLLREMRFDATLPDGSQHTVDGFLTVDDKKVSELPEATVMELHRNGMLGLIHLHWVSMGNMRRLADWHSERNAASKPAVAAPATAAANG